MTLYALHGTKWSVIARGIPGRTDDACSKRYREALDPTLKKDDWTSEEEDRLLQVYARLGGKWGQVGHELNRSGLACRNRYYCTLPSYFAFFFFVISKNVPSGGDYFNGGKLRTIRKLVNRH